MAPGVVKNYQINDLVVNRVFELKHGKALKAWPMDKVSDSPFTQVRHPVLVDGLQTLRVPAEGVRSPRTDTQRRQS
jgi:RNA polymerase-associated protein RTF1